MSVILGTVFIVILVLVLFSPLILLALFVNSVRKNNAKRRAAERDDFLRKLGEGIPQSGLAGYSSYSEQVAALEAYQAQLAEYNAQKAAWDAAHTPQSH